MWRPSGSANRRLWACVASGVLVSLLWVYAPPLAKLNAALPLGWEAALCLGCAALHLALAEAAKLWYNRGLRAAHAAALAKSATRGYKHDD